MRRRLLRARVSRSTPRSRPARAATSLRRRPATRRLLPTVRPDRVGGDPCATCHEELADLCSVVHDSARRSRRGDPLAPGARHDWERVPCRYTPHQGLPPIAAEAVGWGHARSVPDRPAAFSRALPTLLLLLTVFGPISMDLYLPALPALTADLGAVTSVAQLTVTACLIGLAAGQLIAGPLSDRFGRRGILLVGIVAYIATSALCAISPTVELLIAARFVQGLAGGVGIVIAQAAGRDIYTGGALIRFYGRLTVVGGFAAIVGPLLGGLLNSVHRLARTVRLPRRDRRRHPRRDPAGVP